VIFFYESKADTDQKPYVPGVPEPEDSLIKTIPTVKDIRVHSPRGLMWRFTMGLSYLQLLGYCPNAIMWFCAV